jgi:hypothetical protein
MYDSAPELRVLASAIDAQSSALDSPRRADRTRLHRSVQEKQMSNSVEEAAESDRKTVISLALTMVGFGVLTVILIVAALIIT